MDFIEYDDIISEAKNLNVLAFSKRFDEEKLYSFIENYNRE
jgi:hypothetical protein